MKQNFISATIATSSERRAPARLAGGKLSTCRAGARRSAVAALIILAAAATASAANDFKFNFGSDQPAAGWTQVAPTNFYSKEAGHGFEPGAKVVAGKNSSRSDQPFYFSTTLPEGNYQVTATLGGEAVSTTTIKAELRRLMLEKVSTAADKAVEKTFIVNLRTPNFNGTNRVRLKDREQTLELWGWDDKLTLEFNGDQPSLRSLKIEKVAVPTVFLIGDSTVCDQPAESWNSWGQMLPRFFKPEIAVANHAESGETIKGALGAKRFDKIFSGLKPGDYLFVQFGHNDMKDKATNALAVYKANLEKIVARTRALGGTPVLVTSMERKGGVTKDTLGGYPQTVRDVAAEEKVALIDLHALSRIFYQSLGADLDKAFQDGTHHNNYGSYELAKCVVNGIRENKLPLAKSVVDDFSFDPAQPDDANTFEMAASPNASKAKPLGN